MLYAKALFLISFAGQYTLCDISIEINPKESKIKIIVNKNAKTNNKNKRSFQNRKTKREINLEKFLKENLNIKKIKK